MRQEDRVGHWLSNFTVPQDHLEGLFKHRVSDSVDLGQDLRICISVKFWSEAAAADPGLSFEQIGGLN